VTFTLTCAGRRTGRRYGRLVPPAFAGRITFHGLVAGEDMPELYRRADVFCAPSLGPETAGVALLEAMAAGAVVVASRVPGYDEVVHDGVDGLLVPPREPRALAAALRGLLDDPGSRVRLTHEGLRSVRRYDWERVAGEIEGCTTRSRGGGGNRCRAAAASSANCSPTSTSIHITARTA